MEITQEIREKLLVFQKNEITEHYIYKNLARTTKSPQNRAVLEKISQDELKHAKGWEKYTQRAVKPDRWAMWKYTFISRILGLTFGLKLMEQGEESAQARYSYLKDQIDEIERVIKDEGDHEDALIALIDEEHLNYVGSIVLGLNDALVELTGALAGFTLALQNTKLIALSGAITGFAAALSMAASEYISTRSETTEREPLKSAIYTGIAYMITVILLIFPYLFIPNFYWCLAWALTIAVLIIAAFNYYVSIVREEPFRKRFLEMAGVSLGVAGLSFLIGYLFRSLLGIEI